MQKITYDLDIIYNFKRKNLYEMYTKNEFSGVRKPSGT